MIGTLILVYLFSLAVYLAIAVIWIAGVISVIKTDESQVQQLPKLGWLLVVILLGPIGAGIWWMMGRKPSSAHTK